MPTRRFYTAGYLGHSPQELQALLESLQAVLLDIRLNPTSRDPRWRAPALRKALYPSYCACPEFGNRNYKTDGAILIDRPAEGLALALRQEYPVVLLCACRERLSCHRQAVAELLLAEGWEDAGEVPWPTRS